MSESISRMRILLTGASGQLGSYVLRELVRTGIDVAAWSGSRTGTLFGVPLQPVDLALPDAVVAAYQEVRPTHIIHAAAMAGVADCYRDPQRAFRVNVQGTGLLAELAVKHRARLLFVSTDMVFDGEKPYYREGDPPTPLSVYGRTKAQAESAVMTAPNAVVARVSLLFGPTLNGRPAFFDQQLAALREGRPLPLFEDEWRTPLSLRAAAPALITLLRSDYEGLIHLGGPERLSRLDMGRRLARFLRQDDSVFLASRRGAIPSPEPRPRDVSLDSSRWRARFPHHPWPSYEEALRDLEP